MTTFLSRTPHRVLNPLFLVLLLGGPGCAPDGGGGGGSPGGAGGQGAAGGRGGTGGSRTGGSGGSTGGSAGTGGATGGSGGATGGSGGATGGSGGATGGSGGAGGSDAGLPDSGVGDATAEAAAGDGGSPPDAPSGMRPDAMGAACATGQNYGFTIRPFTSQTGMFTAYFTVTPSRAPTNSVIGLSDGMKYLHDHFAAIVRFGTSGNLDVRNGAAYSSVTPIRYKVTDYHFRLVVNVPAGKYSAYVSFEGMPEVTLGTDLAFRDSAGTVTKLNYWGVEAVAGSVTRVCGFLVQ